MASDWFPLWLSLRYAGASTMLAALVALPLAWVLVHRGFPGSDWVDAAASLPLILPPAVLVYYLLASLGRWPLHFTLARGRSRFHDLHIARFIAHGTRESGGGGPWARECGPRFGRGRMALLLAGHAAARNGEPCWGLFW